MYLYLQNHNIDHKKTSVFLHSFYIDFYKVFQTDIHKWLEQIYSNLTVTKALSTKPVPR